MRAMVLAAIPMMALAGGAAAEAPATTAQCLESTGRLIPAVCQVPGSRLESREQICSCPNGGERITVAVCGKDQAPPPEGKALTIARREAMRDGSLVGDTVAGQPICVRPRRP
ncbi:MAG: hypothetical protein GC203_06415 [Phenylobacterium sp.]|uniref:hypothetical protein n=1 Tax=Phenylobacterium sp. TaxID=1871053 RepID=UPI0025DF17A2|nr:hypothetical protein [Phenylobacterium sp.]MBI1197479.1 hypothetical protein [Phenylobacterium sp.]